MALDLVRTVVEIPRVSQLPNDVVVNVFHHARTAVGAPSETELDAINVAVRDFYNTTQASGRTIANHFPQAISRVTNAARVVQYYKEIDPDGGVFGSPVRTVSWTIGAILAGPPVGMPGEACVALSFNGDLTNVPETQSNPSPPPAVIRPAARRRGRVFIGPISTGGITENSGSNFEVIPSTQLVGTIAQAAETELLGGAYTGGFEWVVYSPTDDDAYPVVEGFVDNAFDTQRRRGNESTGRSVWP